MIANYKESFCIRSSSIAEIFYKAVEKYPKRSAVILPDRSFSYAELNRLVSLAIIRIKEHLHATDCRIAIIGNNHPAYVVAYFAAQCLNTSTVEAGRHESLDTLVNIVDRTGTCFVLTDRDDLRKALHAQLPVESFQEFLSACETYPNGIVNFPKVITHTESSKEASIIYTSGTTSSSKGVILSHENFCYIAYIVADYLKLNKDDLYAYVLPLCHTYGKSILLSSFAVGAAVVLLENFQNLSNFLNLIVDKKCTILSVVPYHIHMLLKGGTLSKYNLSSLRSITSSGNKLEPTTIDRLKEELPRVQIFSMYGLTESTTRATYVPPEILSKKKESCGRPLPGVEIKIVKEDGSNSPIGQVGEVFLRGPNIMKAYFADSKLTSETLVDGWLKTGDLGHLDEDGYLYLDGRKKDIIKCCGERISALEIEQVLMEHPEVEEAAVIGSQDSLMGEIVHAYVVPRSSSLKKGELRDHCIKRLSHHKIPYRYSFIEKLPKTATGKVQKYLLDRD